MTEKRFTIDKAGGVFYIFDNGTLLPINDGEPIVDLLNELHEENEQLTKLLILIADAESARSENSVKEILRNTLFGLDTVAGESPNAFKEYCILNKFFKEHYKEHWDNDKYD